MAVPHYSYYPPAGSVIDASDGRVTWDGRAWKLNGRIYGVPSTHSLIGKPGGPLAGWSYDWQKHAWMEPSAPTPPPTTRLPVRQQPKPQPTRKAPTTIINVEQTKLSPIESLIKHPVAPVIGGVLVAASYLTDEPTPPAIPEALPEATAKQWMMVYQQNQQRFARRMDLYKDLGLVLLGYASAQTIMDALPKASAPMVATVNPDVRARSIAGHRAL